MRFTLLLAAVLAACAPEQPATETTERKKTMAEETFEAGQNARKKAEQIKADQKKKVDQAVEETEP